MLDQQDLKDKKYYLPHSCSKFIMPSSHLFLDREQRVIKETVGNW
jgi:hypothetical protein